MRFQIALEGKGLVFLFEGTVKLNVPWTEFGRMRATALVMGEESLFEIPSEADIGLVRPVYTPDDINIKHSPRSVSLRSTSQGTLRQIPIDSFTCDLSPFAYVACHAKPAGRSVEAAGVEPASPANKPAATTCLVRKIFSAVRWRPDSNRTA